MRVDLSRPSGAFARGFVNTPTTLVVGRRARARERARKKVVRIIIFIYLLAIFEGALRKWVLPQFGQYLFFIRDPFLLWVYVIATRHGLWPRKSLFLRISLGMAAFGVALAAIQSGFGGFESSQLILAAYGWRNYFLYIPLAFLIGAQFREADLLRVYRWTLWLAIPIAALIVIQFRAPIGSAINVGIAQSKDLQFRGLGVDPEHTRPMGTFTSSTGQVAFVTSAFTIFLGLFVARKKLMPTGRIIPLVAGVAILVCLAFGQSRAAMVECGAVVIASVGFGLISKNHRSRWRATVLPIVLVAGAATIYPIVFPEGFQVFVHRWETASITESEDGEGGIVGRALFQFVDFTRLFDQVPALGYGLGMGGNASTRLGFTIDGVAPGALAESDWARHMVDVGPIFGVIYIIFRGALVSWLAWLALGAGRRYSNPMPILLFALVGPNLLYGQVTGHGTVNVYAWLFMGFCIAAAKTSAPAISNTPCINSERSNMVSTR